MELRELKALEIAARCKLTYRNGTWFVPSQSDTKTYRVVIDHDVSCECDDFQIRRGVGELTEHVEPCKHIIACRLVQERDGKGTSPVSIGTEIPKKPTYRQADWGKYDLAQETEKDRFQELLFDLCSGVEEPSRPTNLTGRKPIPLADQIFCCAFKVFSTMSSRRFACDLAEAHRRGFLSTSTAARCINLFMEDEKLTPILEKLIIQSSLPLRAVETVFAPDSTGFSVSRFVRWVDEKYGTEKSGRDWVKAHAMVGARSNIVTAVRIEGRNAADSPQLPSLVKTTADNFTMKDVTADKAYLSHDNLQAIHNVGATPFIPFKSNSKSGETGSLWERMYHFYQFNKNEFLKRYHQRSNCESCFAMLKAKFRDHVRSKSDVAMKNEVLCKFLCHNVVVVHQSIIELGIEGTFWENKPKTQTAVLKFPGVG